MCTAVSWKSGHHYFGRNLDLHYAYREQVTITPRNYPFRFKRMPSLDKHYSMIGVATIIEGYPLYYEATNEMGLSMAGLNFPESAYYPDEVACRDNVSPFELIPWILGQCATISDAAKLLSKINLVNIPFAEQLPLTPLHWMIADKEKSLTVESTADGLKIHENGIGVLTNDPPFDYHMYHLKSYMQVSAKPVLDRFSSEYKLHPFSSGMGAIGLPGDYSSSSRFVKAAFVKLNSVSDGTQAGDVNQFFHILGSVSMPRGCVEMSPGEFEITRYSSCCDTDNGIYYYTTYQNSQITAVDMHRADLDSSNLISYQLNSSALIHLQN